MRGISMSVNNTELKFLIRAVRQVAWGAVFLYVNINIDNAGFQIQLMPEWTGWLLYFYACVNLSYTVPSAALLQPLAKILFGIELVRWILTFMGIRQAALIIYIFAAVVSLYFNFQLFSSAETAARRYHLRCADSILFLRTFLVIVTTLIHLTYLFGTIHPEFMWLHTVLSIAGLIAAGGIVTNMFEFLSQLKKGSKKTV